MRRSVRRCIVACRATRTAASGSLLPTPLASPPCCPSARRIDERARARRLICRLFRRMAVRRMAAACIALRHGARHWPRVGSAALAASTSRAQRRVRSAPVLRSAGGRRRCRRDTARLFASTDRCIGVSSHRCMGALARGDGAVAAVVGLHIDEEKPATHNGPTPFHRRLPRPTTSVAFNMQQATDNMQQTTCRAHHATDNTRCNTQIDRLRTHVKGVRPKAEIISAAKIA
jgi:hypothetical protein